MQVVYVSKKHGFVMLYITATDNDESADWVASIRQGMLYHTPSRKRYSCFLEFMHIVESMPLECSGEQWVFYHLLWDVA